MPKKLIALILSVVMTSHVITPLISYGGTAEIAGVAAEDSVTSGGAVTPAEDTAVEESSEITAGSNEIVSGGSSSDEEIISADLDDLASEGSCGDRLTWILSDGVLTISGEGAMEDYSSSGSPWYDSRTSITSVTVGEGVTYLGKYAFSGCTAIEEVTLPNTLTSVGEYSFRLCRSLTGIDLPDGISEIGAHAFSNCSGLKKIELPSELTELSDYMFEYASALKSVVLPEGLTVIDTYAFDGCSALTEINFPSTLEKIEKYAFRNTSALNIDFVPPESLTVLDTCAMASSGIKSVVIPSTLTSIDSYAFNNCKSLVSAEFKDGVTAVPAHIFNGCSLLSNVSIPESVTAINNNAFHSCAALETVELPSRLTYLGHSAFYNSGLTEITVPGSIGGNLDECVFKDCSSLTKIEFEEGITFLPYSTCISNTALSEVILPSTLTTIGKNVFQSCSALKTITIPESVTSIDDYAFRASGLTEATIYSGITYGTYVYYDCRSLTSVVIEEGVTVVIGDFFQCYALTDVEIGSGLVTVGKYAFYACKNLSEVILPSTVTKIGSYAFWGCTSLTKAVIPDSVTSIEPDTFSNCDALTLYVVSGSYAEEYAINNDIPYELTGNMISVNVTDENGEKISSSLYTVNWYETGSDTVIAEGKTLIGAKDDTVYEYEIILDSSIAKTYYQPERTEVSVGDSDAAVECILKLINLITVSGKIVSDSGEALSGVEITFTQTFSDSYVDYVYASSVSDGSFTSEISNVKTIMSLSAEGYYDTKKSVIKTPTDETEIEIDTVAMSKLSEEIITLTLKVTYAAAEDDEAYTSYLTNFNSLVFSVYNNTQGKSVSGFTAQYPYIVFNSGAVNAGDSITISITDSNGAMTCSDITVELDENKCGSGEAEFTENGKIYLSGISGNDENTVIVFDSSGSLVKSYTAGTSLTTDNLADGSYDIVLLTKTTLLKSVANKAKLSELGLSSGSDYAEITAQAKSGVITEISGVTVPVLDESSLYYTVSDNTMLYLSSNSVTAGRYFSVNIKYEIDSKYSSSGEKIIIELPEGIAFVDSSLTLDGSLSAYTQSDNTVSAITNKSSGTIRFYAVGLQEGEYDICAYLSFSNNSDSVLQPIGAAAVNVSGAEIEVPSKSGVTTVPIKGTALKNSKVTVYDNYEAVGTTTANSNGNWSLDIELYKPYAFSYHSIYAEIENSSYSGTVVTDEEFLTYNQNYVQLSAVTMYNTAHTSSSNKPVENVTVFDFLNISSSIPNYRYWPDYPTFTFKVEFVGGKASEAENVYVITKDSQGSSIYIECEYISSGDYWIGTHNYTSYTTIPVSVTASYNTASNVPITISSARKEAGKQYLEEASDNLEELKEMGEITESVIYDDISEDSGLGSKVVCFSILDENTGLYYDIYSYIGISVLPESIDYSELTEFNYENGESLYMNFGYTDNSEFMMLYDTSNNRFYYIISSEDLETVYSDDSELSVSELLSAELKEYTNAEFADSNETSVKEAVEVGKTILSFAADLTEDPVIEKISGIVDNCDTVVSFGSSLQGYIEKWNRVGQINEAVNKIKADPLSYIESDKVAKLQSIDAELTIAAHFISAADIMALTKDLYSMVYSELGSLLGFCTNNALESAQTELDKKIDDLIRKLKELGLTDEQLRELGLDFISGEEISQSLQPIVDPSGYVYEAVPSNRVEGVTATIYYSSEVLNDYDETTGETEAVVWDAEDYDQKNPLITDANGEYAWDVPIGSWQVKYEKSGYTTAYSEWLPVPPPQFDVNQALVSTEAPAVESINIYEDNIQVIFSKYMKLPAGEAITVTADGEEIEGTVTASNAEYNGDETEEYASIFTFTPNNGFSGEIAVNVSAAEGYNGLMSAAYSAVKTAVVRPRYINSADSITVKYNSGALLEVEILPNEAAEGLILEASTASDKIASVTNSEITLDDSGTANIMLNGELVGQTVLTLSIQGTDISKEVTVNVAMNAAESSKCTRVTASIASGSTVEAGTELVLSTETEGAEIYYTLDGTCPCTVGSASRLLYTGPITLTEDTFLIAYAVKDGYEDSNTAGFIYTVAAATTETTTVTTTETTTETTTVTTTETTTKAAATETTTKTTTTETTTETTTKATTETTTKNSSKETTTKATTETTIKATTEATTETTTKATTETTTKATTEATTETTTETTTEATTEIVTEFVSPPAFKVAGVFGGRNVTFTSESDGAVIYYSSTSSTLTTDDISVSNGEAVLFEDFYGTIYARAYRNGSWSNVSRLILKIPVVNTPTVTASGSKVTIKSTTPSSFICYTTDGTVPVIEPDGTVTNGTWLKVNGARTNSGTVTASPGNTIRAVAVRNCFTTSASAAVYVKVEPTAFKVVGTFGGRNVTFTSDTSGAKIYYSSTTSSLTTSDKCVSNGETVLFEDFYGTIYARAYYNGKWSNVSRLILKIPTINTPTITYSGGKATIRTTTPNCYIYYTTDGTTPSVTNGKKLCSNSYGQVTVSSGTTIKAIAVRSCFTNSEVVSYKVS